MNELRETIIQEYILIGGVILDRSTYAFCAELLDNKKKGISKAYIFYYVNNCWKLRCQLEMQPISITFSPYEKDEIFVLGREGESARVNANNVNSINISNGQDYLGSFRKIKNIGGVIFVLGEDCSLWTFDANRWIKIKDGLNESQIQLDILADDFDEDDYFDQLIENTEVAFSIAGDSKNEIFHVGTGGELGFFDGNKWIKEVFPTNLTLYDICRAEHERYIICGIKGTIIVGESQKWRVVDLGDFDRDLFSVAEFLGTIFVADGHSLFRLDDGVVSKVNFGAEESIPSHFVASRSGVVLSLSAKEVLVSTDGDNWDSLLF